MTAAEHHQVIKDKVNAAVINELIAEQAALAAQRDTLAEELKALKAKHEPDET